MLRGLFLAVGVLAFLDGAPSLAFLGLFPHFDDFSWSFYPF